MKDNNSNKLVLYNFFSTFLLYMIAFVSAPIFSRLLGTDGYGVVQTYNAWAQFLTIVIGFCTRSTLPIAKVNIDDSKLQEYESSVMGLSSTIFFLFLAIGIFIRVFTKSVQGFPSYLLIVMIVQCFGQYCVSFLNTVYTYEMKARLNLILSVLVALFNFLVPCTFIFLFDSNKAEARIIGTAIVYMVAGIVSYYIIMKRGKLFWNKQYWRFCIPLCIPLIFHGFASVICSSSDRIMLSKMTNMSDVGIYALACNFAYIIDSIWNALHNSWDPIFMYLVKNDKYSELKERSKEYAFVFTGLVVGFLLLSPDVFKLFADQRYWSGIQAVKWIVLSEFATFIYAFGVNFEFVEKKTNMIAIGSIISATSNIILNYFFINSYGFIGAAIATFISNAVLAIVHIIFAKRIAKEWVYSTRFFVKYSVVVLMAFFMFNLSFLIRWGLAFIVGVCLILKVYKTRRIF